MRGIEGVDASMFEVFAGKLDRLFQFENAPDQDALQEKMKMGDE
jgi:hypothetical protein